MAAIATWSFGIEAVKVASRALADDNVSCIDAVEMGINSVEEDPDSGVYLVGRGGYPNREGTLQLDAAIMRGTDCTIGSICSLEGFSKPISVARHLMEHSSTNFLVGNGAMAYATANGFQKQTNESLLTDASIKAYKEFKKKSASTSSDCGGHDTLAMICLDRHGNICTGVSTSGRPFKLPGRVGDSPLPGCGFYADNTCGGAAATGDGEIIMKYCPSFKIADLMRHGRGPQEACDMVVKDITAREKEGLEMGVIALDMKGNIGASGSIKEWTDVLSGTVYNGFPYAVWKETTPTTTPTIMTSSSSSV